jgi:hypothetical protein
MYPPQIPLGKRSMIWIFKNIFISFFKKPNGKGRQQCLYFDKARKGFEVEDYECENELSFICRLNRKSPPFSLRGLCPRSSLDSLYLFSWNVSSFTYVGFTQQIIELNKLRNRFLFMFFLWVCGRGGGVSTTFSRYH